MLRVGARLKSQVCNTQVIVVRVPETVAADLRAGGSPLIPIDVAPAPDARLSPDLSDGALLGKRYTDDSGVELLVTKPGAGTLSNGSAPLRIKEARGLPASD